VGKEKRLERPIRLLIGYSIVLCVSYLALSIFSSTGLVFGLPIEGMAARAISLVMSVLSGALASGLYIRDKRAYAGSLIVYSASILSSVSALFSMDRIRESSIGPLTDYIYPLIALTVLLNSLTLFFVYRKRAYFLGHRTRHDWTDKLFSYSMYGLTAGASVFLLVSGIGLVRTVGTIDRLMPSINDQTLTESLFYCEEKSGNEHDLCYVALVVKHPQEESIDKLCDRVVSRFYRYTCYRALA
jgi:hypothetical protein